MFRNILVPLDGSVFAEQALPHTEYLARMSGATIHIVRVIELPTTWIAAPLDGSFGAAAWAATEAIADRLEAAAHYLRMVARRLGGAGISVRIGWFQGLTAPALVRYAGRAIIDLVVIRGRQRGRPARPAFGSVTGHLPRHSPAPVLVVHPDNKPVSFTSILVPLDGTLQAERAIPVALRLAPFFPQDVELVRVIGAAREGSAAVHYLADTVSRFVRAPARCNQSVALGDVVGTIVDRAGSKRLIVVAAAKPTFLSRVSHLLRGSPAERIAHESHTATLLLPPTWTSGSASADAAPATGAPAPRGPLVRLRTSG